MDLSSDKTFQATKLLYGIPEAVRLWFETYHLHHISHMIMTPCTTDPCMLYGYDSDINLPNITALQVDDSIGNGTSEFLKCEEGAVKRFQCKPKSLLTKGTDFIFNGVTVCRHLDGTYSLTLEDNLRNPEPKTNEELVPLRDKLQYVAGCARPDLSGPVQLLATAVRDPTVETFKTMISINSYCTTTGSASLHFVQLDVDSLHLVAFTDAAFRNAAGLGSKLGYIIVATDATGTAKIVNYGSTRCRRIARSIVTDELLALVEDFDAAYVLKHILSEILQRTISLDIYTDCRTAFNIVAKDASSLQKRLQVDAHALRQSHNHKLIRHLGWIPGRDNPADGLTRLALPDEDHSLRILMKANKLVVIPEGWTSPQMPSAKASRISGKKVRFQDFEHPGVGDTTVEKE